MSSGTTFSDTTFVLTDIETTGFSPTGDRIIEIAMARYRNGEVEDTYETLINPQRYVSQTIQNITGIDPIDLKSAPVFEEVHKDILAFIGDGVLVAHNIGFDYSFLKQAFKELDVGFHPERLCTVQLSRRLFPELPRYGLDSIIDSFRFICIDRHRAMGDVHVMIQLFNEIIKRFTDEEIDKTLSSLIHKEHLPPHLRSIIEKIPNTPGVYFFYDDNGALLYVGKSVHLKERIKSHFSDTKNNHYLSFTKLIKDIDYEITAGDIEAQLKEAAYIKERMPIHNHQLRRVQKMVYAVVKTNDDGYLQPNLVQEMPALESIDQVIGMYRSRKKAREHFEQLVKEYDLCDKLMGLQKTGTTCFGYHLNRCNGACIREESPALYNAKFNNAFAKSRLREWPYSGPVAIREYNENFGIETVHIVDRWCYLGKATSFDDATDTLEQQRLFDHDMYMILLRALFDDSVEKIVL